MKILRLGDPHCKVSNLKESGALMRFVLDKFLELKVDRLEILGDIFDTHSIVRLEVLEFWGKWFELLNAMEIDSYILVGNHDMGGDYTNDYSALNVFDNTTLKHIIIVNEPMSYKGISYIPYIHDNTKFIETANQIMAVHNYKTLVSHTTYSGSKYDNGMFAPDGVDQDLIDPRFTSLISGHVHSEQEFGRVWYPGTARWLTKSCANRRKGIWLCEHSEDGTLLSKEFISTESVCTPIISLVWKEGEDKPEIPPGNTNIELIGSSDWVTKQKVDLKGLVSISSKLTDTKKSKERKSGKSLHEFLSNHYPTEPDKRAKLLKYLGDLNLV